MSSRTAIRRLKSDRQEKNRRGAVPTGRAGFPAAVEPFLYNLFCDPDIIDFFGAWFARRPLARYIARKRAGVVREHYDAIGGHSPIRLLTERQARALEAALAPHVDARCFIAMRYWNPLTAEAAAEVNAWGAPELVLLPLYPQYSFATTSSSLKEWKRLYPPERKCSARAYGRKVLRSPTVHPGRRRKNRALAHAFRRAGSRAHRFQRARIAAEPDRARRSLRAAGRGDRAARDAARRLEERAHAVLSEQSRAPQMAVSFADRHASISWRGREKNICWSCPSHSSPSTSKLFTKSISKPAKRRRNSASSNLK